MHKKAPALENDPAPQLEHTDAPFGEYLPAAQFEQRLLDEPVEDKYVPNTQSVHPEDPVAIS